MSRTNEKPLECKPLDGNAIIISLNFIFFFFKTFFDFTTPTEKPAKSNLFLF